jgi:HD superfamily phosphodiesterase
VVSSRARIGGMKSDAELEKRLLEANKRRYQAATNPLRSHGPDHHERVWRKAVALAERLGVTYDVEVLAGACLLHDMAAYYPEKSGEQYHDFDHVIAEEVLREVEFPEDKVGRIVDAIKNHGSDPKYKQTHESIETVLLRDADKLDAFGPVGCARIVMVRTLKGDTLQQIVDDFWTRGHLKRKWDSISTEEARELVRTDYEYSRDFFERLAEGLRLENI